MEWLIVIAACLAGIPAGKLSAQRDWPMFFCLVGSWLLLVLYLAGRAFGWDGGA